MPKLDLVTEDHLIKGYPRPSLNLIQSKVFNDTPDYFKITLSRIISIIIFVPIGNESHQIESFFL